MPYLAFLVRNAKRRPRSELLETALLMVASLTVVVACALTGPLWTLAVVYLIPERVAMFVLAWWFDWLPHHDLEDTQHENRCRATRNRVGAEWILTPLLLSQNYHLVHHLHPLHALLLERGAEPDRVHVELFHGYQKPGPPTASPLRPWR